VRVIISICFISVVLGSAPSAVAQILDDGRLGARTATTATLGGAFYDFSTNSGCDLTVSVWGYVRNPGRYRVPCETNLIDLLSFCGGPLELNAEAYLYRIKIVRRGGADNQNEIAEVFEVDVDRYLRNTRIPSSTTELFLWPNDLIIVDGKEARGDTILRIAQIVVAIASIVTSTVAVINITK